MEIWINPACSKCRSALSLLDAEGAEYTVRRYLDEPPSAAELEDVLNRLNSPDAVIIDTRSDDEYTGKLVRATRGGRIPGAPPDWPAAANLTPGIGSAMLRYGSAEAFRTMLRTGRLAAPFHSRVFTVARESLSSAPSTACAYCGSHAACATTISSTICQTSSGVQMAPTSGS